MSKKFNFEVYTIDQRFKKNLHKFMEFWELLALKKGTKRSVKKVRDINGWILFYWDNLNEKQQKQFHKKSLKSLLKLHEYSDFNIFTQQDNNKVFIEELEKFEI